MEEAAGADPSALGAPSSSRLGAWAPWILAASALLAFANSFSVPFLFDDLQTIVGNPQVRAIWPPWHFVTDRLSKDIGTSGRPVGGLAFALSYALGGLRVAGWHVFNLAVHVSAALALFGIVRRTLRLPLLRERWAADADAVAFAISLLWVVHPLQTKSVTYVVQRLESLAGLLCLLTLYCALRGSTDGRPRRWFPAAVAASALAMGTKEIAFVAPLAVLLYDRTFLAGSFRSALRARGKLHAALASTWVVLAALIAASPRIRVAGEAFARVSPLDYAKTQCWAILHYLGLAAWPSKLTFDYGMAGDGVPMLARPAQYLPWAAAILGLLFVTLVGVWKNRGWGFLGVVFFLVLLPSSSFVPIAQEAVAEHRMYLPLAAVLTLVVTGGFLALRSRASALVGIAAVLATAFGARTFARNRDYASDLAIWSDTVSKRPHSARAQTNLGLALYERGDLEAAAEHQREAIRLNPDYSEGHHGLALTLLAQERVAEAEAELRAALAISPQAYESRLALGEVLLRRGELVEAAEQFRLGLEVRPDLPHAHLRLGSLRHDAGALDEAIAHYRQALAYEPANVQALNLLGLALAEQGYHPAAAEMFRRALAIQPDFAEARANLERLREAGVAPR